MYTIDLNDNPHNFEKQNLVTMPGNYDILKCSNCGIEGKTSSISTIRVKGSYSENKIINCDKSEKELRVLNTQKKIRISFCTAQGRQFSNITPQSEHVVIEPPKEHKANSEGVWVMGLGEPVKILNNEFNYVD